MAEIYLSDPDVTIWCGDALDALRQMPDESVDMVCTSPPYWSLRDYQADGQIGLEATPSEYIAALLDVFREIKRVLASHGTVWLNLGDSYFGDTPPRKKSSEAFSTTWDPANSAGQGGLRRSAARLGSLKPKDLVGIPWRTAFALQDDGWYLRCDVIWGKPNPMPESITDRPTKSHEYLFLLAKSSRYFFDQEAVREPAEWNRWGDQTVPKYGGTQTSTGWIKPKSKYELMMRGRQSYPSGATTGNPRDGEHIKGASGGMPSNPAGRNVRSVWTIPTQPYADAHFATFPIELPRRAIAAGCPLEVCTECGQPRMRIVEREIAPPEVREKDETTFAPTESQDYRYHNFSGQRYQDWLDEHPPETVGWTDCGHGSFRTGVVLDPFFGSGTTALAARELNRNAIGIEINEEYCALAARRLQQLSLFSDVAET